LKRYHQRIIMKIFSKILVLLAFSFAQNSAFAVENDPSISGFLRGNICRAIDAKYPNALVGSKTSPGLDVCRKTAPFYRWSPQADPNLIVIQANLHARIPMTCTARVLKSSIDAKTPPILVACKLPQ
jgi:hypothetical protein